MKLCLLVPALAATLLFAADSSAQPNPERPYREGAPAGEGRRLQRPPQDMQPGGPGGFRGSQGLPVMEQVLTEDQRDSMRQAMEAQRETMRGLQEKIRDARKALMTAALAEDYNEAKVKARALEVAKLEAEIAVIRLKALAEVQPALSKEQLDKILNPQPRGAEMREDGERPARRRANRPPGDEAPRPPQPTDQ